MTAPAQKAVSPTPILDGEKEFEIWGFAKYGKFIDAACYGLLALAFALDLQDLVTGRAPNLQRLPAWIKPALPFLPYDLKSLAIFFGIGFVLLYVVIAIHELGHMLAGFKVGMRFCEIYVGALHIRKVDAGKLAVDFNIRHLLRLNGGVVMYPVRDDERLRDNEILVLSGGPVTTIFSVVMVEIFYYAGPRLFPFLLSPQVRYLHVWFIFWSTLSVVFGSLWVNRDRSSDGARILLLLQKDGGRYARSMFAVGKIDEKLSAGEPLETLSSELIEMAMDVPRGTNSSLVSNAIAYDWALERDDLERAALHLERCLEAAGGKKESVEEWVQEAAFFQGCNRQDAAKSSLWMGRMDKKKLKKTLYGVIAEASALWNSGQYEKAVTLLDLGLVSFRNKPDWDGRGEDFCTYMKEWMEEELPQQKPLSPVVG